MARLNCTPASSRSASSAVERNTARWRLWHSQSNRLEDLKGGCEWMCIAVESAAVAFEEYFATRGAQVIINKILVASSGSTSRRGVLPHGSSCTGCPGADCVEWLPSMCVLTHLPARTSRSHRCEGYTITSAVGLSDVSVRQPTASGCDSDGPGCRREFRVRGPRTTSVHRVVSSVCALMGRKIVLGTDTCGSRTSPCTCREGLSGKTTSIF